MKEKAIKIIFHSDKEILLITSLSEIIWWNNCTFELVYIYNFLNISIQAVTLNNASDYIGLGLGLESDNVR